MFSFFEFLSDLLVPEEEKLAKLSSLDVSGLRRLLPRAERPTEDNTFSVFDYRNRMVKNLIWAIKYKNNKKLLDLAGKIIYENILSFAEDRMIFENKNKIILVPIPMDSQSERERGWNQSLELAKAVAKLDPNISVLEILEKSKTTGHQHTLSRKDRLQNIKNSIGLRQGYARQVQVELKDSLLVIIDDVTTTGATLTEARRALGELGIEDVLAVTLAH